MKTKQKLFFALLAILLSLPSLEAQYGYGYGYGNGYGRNRMRNQFPDTQSQEKKEPLTAEEIVELQMPKILEVIDFNAFEQAIMKTTLTKYIKKYMELEILKLEGDKMKESVERLQKEQKEELKAALPKDKFDAFYALQEEGYKKARKNKKKKKKKPKKKE